MKASAKWGGNFLLAILWVLPIQAQETQNPSVKLVLVKIDSYPESREILQEVRKIDGVRNIRLSAETPGLIHYEIDFDSNPTDLSPSIRRLLGDRYSVNQKTLPNGTFEINIVKKG